MRDEVKKQGLRDEELEASVKPRDYETRFERRGATEKSFEAWEDRQV